MRQVAADGLGLAPEKVTVRLGDTRLPESHASIGSATMANAGASVMLAAKNARDKAIELALTGQEAPFAGSVPEDVLIDDGRLALVGKNVNITYAELLARNGLAELVADGDYDPVEEASGPKAIFSFSAVFAEVRVDPELRVGAHEPLRWCLRRGSHHQPQDRAEPGDRRHHLGHRASAARAVGDRIR